MYVRCIWATEYLNSQGQVSSLTHRWVPNPRYDSLEAFNNDFSNTYKPKMNVYGKSAFSWLARVNRSGNGSGQRTQSLPMFCGRPSCNASLTQRISPSRLCLYTQAVSCQVRCGLSFVSEECEH